MQYDIGKHKQNAKHKQVSISLNIHNSGMHVSTVKKRKYRRTHDGNDNDDDDCDGDLRSPWIQQWNRSEVHGMGNDIAPKFMGLLFKSDGLWLN